MVTPTPDMKAEGPWVETWLHGGPRPPFKPDGEFDLTYSATSRVPEVRYRTKTSNKTVLKDAKGFDLLKTLDTGQDTTHVFAGKELYWSNKLRQTALAKGVEKHLPKIFYLIRPETAYTSALHFLARELGGCESFEKEQNWISMNQQLHCLLKTFWSQVQEVHWSGAMSPGISNEERSRLFLELIGAFNYSSSEDGEVARGENSLPVPHLSESMLKAAGIVLPDTMYNLDVPPEYENTVRENLKRTNYPGIPGDLPGLLHCWLCNKGFDTVADRKKHTKETQEMCATAKCDGCGLKFSSGREYKLHAYTFCPVGPYSQSKCPCCSVAGPACLCKTHWTRTYGKISSLMEGRNPASEWLIGAEDNEPGLLVLGSIYMGAQLSKGEKDTPRSPPSPFALPASLWEEDLPLPTRVDIEGETRIMLPSGQEWNYESLVEISTILGIDLKTPVTKVKVPEAPTSLKKKEARGRIYQEEVLGAQGITAEDADPEDFERLNELIKNADTQMETKEGSEMFCVSLGMNEQEVEKKVEALKTLRRDCAIKLSKAKLRDTLTKDRKKKLGFGSLSDFRMSEGSSDPALSKDKSPSPKESAADLRIKSPLLSPPLRKREISKTARRTSSRSPGVRTATSMRGSSRTHTIYLALQRAMTLLDNEVKDPEASSYKRVYSELKSSMQQVDKHLKYDPSSEVDPAYSEMLEELYLEAEQLLHDADSEGDDVVRERKRKEQIMRCLPRSAPQKWDGSLADFIRFKQEAKTLMENIPNKRLALNAILDTISDGKMRKRLSKYDGPESALKSLELEFGNPELSGPKIVADMRKLAPATGTESESAIILKLKELYVSLTEIRQTQLLGRVELYNLCHLFNKTEGQRILKKLQRIKDPEALRVIFFDEIDELYTSNTVWTRTKGETDGKAREQPRSTSGRTQPRTFSRRVGAENRQRQPCLFCSGDHPSFKCSKEVEQITLDQLKKKQVCPGCIGKEHAGKCEKRFQWYQCKSCGHNKALKKLHVKCGKPDTKKTPAADGPPSAPPQPGTNSTNRRHKVQGVSQEYAWRSEGGAISNPNPLNSAFELIDHAVIEAPDGRLRKIRVLHDQYAADSTLADISLESFSHRTGGLDLAMHTAIGTTRIKTDEMVLKIRMPNGGSRFVKTISTEMRSQKAFTLIKKCIDVPVAWNRKHFRNTATIGPNNNIRCLNFVEGSEVELLLGADCAILAPVELDRFEDAAGSVVLYRSCLQEEVMLLGGSRLVGQSLVPTSGTQQRAFRFTTEDTKEGGRQAVSVRRVTSAETDPVLFPATSLTKMTKLDQEFFNQFQDSNLLLPHPRACQGCAECPTCSDIAATEKRMAMEKRMDELCVLTRDRPWPEGGWKISLQWNALKEKVPVNKEDCIRRFLQTERSIIKSPAARSSFNEHVEKCLRLGYFVLEKDFGNSLEGYQVSYLPLSYALKDTVANQEEVGEAQQKSGTEEKTKARPVSDGSHKASNHTPSVNEALTPLPDLWTGKIQNLLIKFRTANRLALADISQYYHRLRLNDESVAMTKAIWREGGIGGAGQLVTMIVPSASMGLTPVPSLASHCRARTADLIDDPVARESIKHSYVDDVYLHTSWQQDEAEEQDKVLIKRIQETEKALAKAHLQLGGSGWITDLNQENIPIGTEGVTGVTSNLTSRDIGVSTTGALGLRWNLGHSLPDGGTMSYRVHRPGSLNLLPKRRGQRPQEGELRCRADIRNFLSSRGIDKAGLLRLVMNLYDCLNLALPWTAAAKILYREVLTENPGLGWKGKVPEKYYPDIENLATDLLTLSREQSFPRRALQKGPDGTLGHITLVVCHDGSAASAATLGYIHQQWPFESARLPSAVTGEEFTQDESNISTKVTLLCGGHKLTDQNHAEQVASELLSAVIAVKMKKVIVAQSLVKFHRVLYLGDSLTVARVLRKSNRAYNAWAASRVSFVQRNEDLDLMFHVPGQFLCGTVDKGTRAHANPSSLMDHAYWYGTGTIDTPLHMFPITPTSEYIRKGMEDLPEKWVNKNIVRLNPVGLSASITCSRVETEEDDKTVVDDTSCLERLKVRHRSLDKVKRVLSVILKVVPRYKMMEASQLWKVCENLLLKRDADIVRKGIKVTKVPASFIVHEDKQTGIFLVKGRSGFSVPILANPKYSMLTRLILKDFHDKNHLASPATIQALVFKQWFVLGGGAAYLKKQQERCPKCRILRAKPSAGLMGKPPDGTTGPKAGDKSIWRRVMIDIAGPIHLTSWAGKRKTRGTQKNIKHFILVSVDLCSRQVDATLLEGYNTSSVLTGLRTLMSKHGTPSDIYWDRASNLRAAAVLLKGDGDVDEGEDLFYHAKVQEDLKRSFERNGVSVHLSIPYSPFRQGRVEAMNKQIKTRLRELCFNESETRLTPMEACSVLAAAISAINQRPLLLTSESTLDEKMVLSPSYLTCADLDLENVSCVEDPTTHRTFNIHESPLNARAVKVQERLERFKHEFDKFMTKSLVSLGKFNQSFRLIKEQDVVLILDKKKQTLPVQCKARYTLGVVEKKLSNKSFRIRYINNSKTERCERSLEGLSLLVSADEAKKAEKIDVVIDPFFPAGPLIEMPQDMGGESQRSPEEAKKECAEGDQEEVKLDRQDLHDKEDPEPNQDESLEGATPRSKKPVVVQFISKGNEVIKDIGYKKKEKRKT